MSRYVITGQGLVPTSRLKLLQPHHAYYMGASSTPDLVIVTSASERHVEIYSYPWRRPQRLERWIAEDLLATGTNTWLESHADLVKRAGGTDDWAKVAREGANAQRPLADALRGLLDGRASPLRHDPVAWQYVRATCRRATGQEGVDLWYHAETFGNVGSRGQGADERYEIVMRREDVPRLKADALLVVEDVVEEVSS